jgi:hypothetical protein
VICRACGTEIADKAIVCYRCGAPTAEPRPPRPALTRGARARRAVLAFLAVVVLIAASVRLVPLAPHGAWRLGAYGVLMLVTFIVLRLIIGPARR